MIKKLEHIGIAVKSIKDADVIFEKLFQSPAYKEEIVDREGIVTKFYKVGNVKIELIESNKENNAISKFIERSGEGIHHLAFEVDDLDAEMKRLKNEGFKLVNESPQIGADNKRVFFLHPSSTNRVLVELCQEIK